MATSILVALTLLVIGVLAIATTTISLECYNSTGRTIDSNQWFLILTLIFAIESVLVSFYLFYKWLEEL